MSSQHPHTLIVDNESLRKHCQAIKDGSSWLGFDTEFIGERRYIPLLCWVQISSSVGNLLIDALECTDFSPLTDLMADESILKITHAGENDYQLFYKLFQTLPKNVVDVQVAVGFLGESYPCSFQKIAHKYAKVRISKSQTVSDWSQRPISDKQTQYALNDVVYLEEIWKNLKQKLENKKRLHWVIEECSRFCNAENYEVDLIKNVLSSKIIKSLHRREQIFSIRLHLWRENEAKTTNQSREKILPSKIVPLILKMMHSGQKTLLNDRRIPDYIIKKHWHILTDLFQEPAREEELALLEQIPPDVDISEKHNIIMDLLNQIFKFICVKNKVAGTLLMPRADFNKMKNDSDYIPPYLSKGWRAEVLGEDMVTWLQDRSHLDILFENGEVRMVIDKEA